MQPRRFLSCLILVTFHAAFAQPAPPAGKPERPTSNTPLTMEEATAQASKLLEDAKCDEATALILNVYPEKTRTPDQALTLGNVLYKQDPKLSYALHKRAAAEMPDSASAQLEWALEQHRAREFKDALASYKAFLVAKPGYAPALGLSAECALRGGEVDEAVKLWKESESATSGTIETLEELVCEVNGPGAHDQERARLRDQISKGDGEAAEKLIFLDCRWQSDWWNTTVKHSYLLKDTAFIELANLANFKDRFAEIRCAVNCAEAKGNTKKILASLKLGGYFLGEGSRVPTSGRLNTIILGEIEAANLISKENLRKHFGQRLLDLARAGKDPEAWNIVAHMELDSEKLGEIDSQAWAATHDARFAASLVAGLDQRGKLTSNHEALIRALTEFPDSAEIARLALRCAKQDNAPLEPRLIAAILAEYRGFSVNGLAARPKASSLRAYFRDLGVLRATAKDKPK